MSAALAADSWRLSGCGPRCWPRQHDPLIHELHGRQQERLALAGSVVRTGPLTVNLVTHTVQLYDLEIWPTAHETQLLEYLAARLGEWCSNDEILVAVWGPEYMDPTRTRSGSRRDYHHVYVTLCRLRRCLGAGRDLVETWVKHGIRLRQEPPYDTGRRAR